MTVEDRWHRFISEEAGLPRWRRVLALDLGLFNVALFLFALLPPTTLVMAEWITMVGAVFCGLGVVSHASPWRRLRIPGDQWAYLATGALGLYVFGVYGSVQGIPTYLKVPFCAFLLSGSASGYAAHVIDGGRRHV